MVNTRFMNLEVRYNVSTSNQKQKQFDLLKDRVMSIHDVHNVDDMASLPVIIINILFNKLVNGIDDWSRYFHGEIESFIKTAYSEMMWDSVKIGAHKSIFGDVITYEQQLWINKCTQNDYRKHLDVIKDVYDHITPWLNPQMHKEMKRQDKGKRYSTTFDKQRREMLENIIMGKVSPKQDEDQDKENKIINPEELDSVS